MNSLSRHAELRCQQRGVSGRLLDLFLQHYDVDRPAGGNRRLLAVKRTTVCAIEGGDRLGNLIAIADDASGAIVTVAHVSRSRRGRRYRFGRSL